MKRTIVFALLDGVLLAFDLRELVYRAAGDQQSSGDTNDEQGVSLRNFWRGGREPFTAVGTENKAVIVLLGAFFAILSWRASIFKPDVGEDRREKDAGRADHGRITCIDGGKLLIVAFFQRFTAYGFNAADFHSASDDAMGRIQ